LALFPTIDGGPPMTMKTMVMAALVAGIAAIGFAADAQKAPDPRIADIVQAGKLRVALGLGSPALAIKDAKTGKVRGPAVELARVLAEKMGVELQTIEYSHPGAVLAGVKNNMWDVTFLAVDPARAADVDFSAPYMKSDFTYLVPSGSSKRSATEMDEAGVRIAVPRGDASDLRLSKLLKHAQLVRTDSFAAALDLLRTGQADACAAPRAVLFGLQSQLPGSRVLDDGFAPMAWAAVVPKGKAGLLAYVSEFIEEAKASGLVKQTIEQVHLRGVQVAPTGKRD
jgi:polar amino acid transport system substrate-binding protein